MKAINLRSVLLRSGFTLTLLCGGMMAFATPARTQVAGRTYKVDIKSTSGNAATVCFKFNNTNTLDITGLGPVITFGARVTNDNNNKWQAVTMAGKINPSVAFSGNERGAFGAGSTIDGDAINEKGNTYTFTGSRDDNCQPPATFTGGADGSIFLQ